MSAFFLLLLQFGGTSSQPCPYGGIGAPAKCSTVSVPENRKQPRGRQLSLSVVVVPATGATSAQVPIVFLPGGPGGDIIPQYRSWTELLRNAQVEHPLLFTDPRGTGASGALRCTLAAEPRRAVSHVRDFLPIAQVRTCRRELAKRADLAQYTTEAIADDLEAVRAALGFERLILFGTSGGTRQALMYLKRYPHRVEAMILSGMVPLSFRMPMHYASDAQAAFDSLARSCSMDRECAVAFPRLRADFDSALSALEREPARVVVRLPGGRVDTAVVTRGIFAERVRTVMYNADAASQLPYVITHAAGGDFRPFVQMMIPGLRPPRRDVVAMGHFLSVTCAEDVARIPLDSARIAAAGTFLGMYRVEQQKAACAEWPRAELPPDHFEPVRSRVPVLFISGAADPVTPARWADSAARHLPNSVHAIMAHAGHGPLFNDCATGLIERFLQTRDPQGVNISCAARSLRPSFYVP
jgi:pimeloyl-ACP methyl ester carboxylesterase